MRWDLYVMLLAIWNCILIPFDVAFEPERSTLAQYVEGFIDICFGVDILVSFNTSFLNEKTGFEVAEYKKIAWNYISGG